jgi:hypothetical protein
MEGVDTLYQTTVEGAEVEVEVAVTVEAGKAMT